MSLPLVVFNVSELPLFCLSASHTLHILVLVLILKLMNVFPVSPVGFYGGILTKSSRAQD